MCVQHSKEANEEDDMKMTEGKTAERKPEPHLYSSSGQGLTCLEESKQWNTQILT
jgi:hypothetical protein